MSRLVLGCLVSLVVAVGCGSAEKAAAPPAKSTAAPVAADPAAEKEDGMVVYRNAKGEVECPVMQVVIRQTAIAKHVDYQGVRYYLCCDACLTQMKMDPGTWAKRAKGQ